MKIAIGMALTLACWVSMAADGWYKSPLNTVWSPQARGPYGVSRLFVRCNDEVPRHIEAGLYFGRVPDEVDEIEAISIAVHSTDNYVNDEALLCVLQGNAACYDPTVLSCARQGNALSDCLDPKPPPTYWPAAPPVPRRVVRLRGGKGEILVDRRVTPAQLVDLPHRPISRAMSPARGRPGLRSMSTREFDNNFKNTGVREVGTGYRSRALILRDDSVFKIWERWSSSRLFATARLLAVHVPMGPPYRYTMAGAAEAINQLKCHRGIRGGVASERSRRLTASSATMRGDPHRQSTASATTP